MRFFPLFFKLAHRNCLIFGLSTKSLETLGVTSVRTYVRPFIRSFVSLFLGNRSLLFSETLQFVRACRCEKNVPSAFLIIFTVLAILAKNCPKWPFLSKNDQNGGFWHFFQNCASEFPYFLLEAQYLESTDNYVFTFW